MSKKEQRLLKAAKALLDEMLPEHMYCEYGQYMVKPEWENVVALQAAVRDIDPSFQKDRALHD